MLGPASVYRQNIQGEPLRRRRLFWGKGGDGRGWAPFFHPSLGGAVDERGMQRGIETGSSDSDG